MFFLYFDQMKQYRLLPVLLFVIPSFCGFAQNCEEGSLNLGTVNDQWVYKNNNLKISFKLPEGWYMFDFPATEKKYLRIGSDYRKMSEVLFGNGDGPMLDMAQVKQLPFDYALIILSLAKLADTAAVIPAPKEVQHNALSLRAYYADTADADTFLKTVYKKVSGKTSGEPEIKEGKLGDLDYRFFSLAAKGPDGNMENKIYGARNFGCVNILIRILYNTDTDLSAINDACGELKIVQ